MGSRTGVFAVDPDAVKEAGDPDGVAAWDALVAQNGGPIATHSHLTPSGGRHALFKWRADRPVTNSAGCLPAGIDVRGDGGFVIVPPLRLPDGRTYQIAEAFDFFRFADAPDWLLGLIETRPSKTPAESSRLASPDASRSPAGNHDRYVQAALDGECAEVARAARGGRNNTLNRAAFSLGTLVGANVLNAGLATHRLYDAATACGLVAQDGQRAVMATIESGLTDGAAKPRTMPEPRREKSGSSGQVGHLQDSGTSLPGAPNGPLLQWHGDAPPTPPPYLITGILPRNKVGIVGGQFSGGKTFVVIDLSVCVLSGVPFNDHAVETPGAVLWLAAEGQNEVFSRIEAAYLHRIGEPPDRLPFAVQVGAVPTLTDADAVTKLYALTDTFVNDLIIRYGSNAPELRLIVIDTLSSAAGFQDENSASEVQRVFNTLRKLSDMTGALVLVIDHYGKMTETGVRGSSVKSDNADAILAVLADKPVEGDVSNRRLAVKKLRQGPAGQVIPFDLVSVPMGIWGNSTAAVSWHPPNSNAAQPTPKPAPPTWSGNARVLKSRRLRCILPRQHRKAGRLGPRARRATRRGPHLLERRALAYRRRLHGG